MGLKERAARRRLKKLVPTREPYLELEQVVWPYRTVGLWPNVSLPEVVLDSRGHRLSRRGEDTVASDNAPADAAFLIGGSYAFGVGASSDAGTLASALWRRSGTPYVNLALPAATSTQELISVLPFANRTTRFVVVSGINNLTAATDAPLDPLFGPSHFDLWLEELQEVTLQQLVHAAWGARKGQTTKLSPSGHGQPRAAKQRTPKGPDEIVANAAGFQLRDLGALRRLVPDEAEVVFALEPIALTTDKELTEEERVIFAALDDMEPLEPLREEFPTHWRDFGSRLTDGCLQLGVPFVDLADASYTGWCFVDRTHMNDRGQEIAAAFLLDALA